MNSISRWYIKTLVFRAVTIPYSSVNYAYIGMGISKGNECENLTWCFGRFVYAWFEAKPWLNSLFWLPLFQNVFKLKIFLSHVHEEDTQARIAPFSIISKSLILPFNAVWKRNWSTLLCANYYVKGKRSQFIYWTCQKSE